MPSETKSTPGSRTGGKRASATKDTDAKGSTASASAAPAEEIYGVAGWFETPAALYHACEALRDAGYQRFDAHTPFPVHGLEKAMGLRPTRFPWLVLAGGLSGLLFAISLAYYTQVISYPLNIGGKESWSYQAYVPIFFELTVLCAGLTCFFGLWAVNGLPRYNYPTFNHPSFHRSTDDVFFVSVEAQDPRFDRAATRTLLEDLGAQEVEELAP
jgi:hypothetical protein